LEGPEALPAQAARYVAISFRRNSLREQGFQQQNGERLMNHPQRINGMAGIGLLAGLILCAAPPDAHAAKVTFHNQLTTSINIDAYVTTVVRGKTITVRGKTLQINAGEKAGYPGVPPNCRLTIYIYDANKPSRLLYQDYMDVPPADIFLAVKPKPNSKKAKVVRAKPDQ
jgi:hypothetical protein